jgi:hypothetical protein
MSGRNLPRALADRVASRDAPGRAARNPGFSKLREVEFRACPGGGRAVDPLT